MGSKRIDHIAFRVANLNKAVNFYKKLLGFVVTDRFFIDFDDGTKARCAALRAQDGKGISIFISEGLGKGGIMIPRRFIEEINRRGIIIRDSLQTLEPD